MKTARRVYIAPGIWREGDRIVAEARIGKSGKDQQRTTKAFPLGTDLAHLRAWQHDARGDLVRARARVPSRGTLAADIPGYVADLPEGQYQTDSANLLGHWAASPLGAMRRDQITRRDVIAQIARWTDDGAAARTCNRRLSRLRKFYVAMNGGPDVPNPTDTIKFLPQPEIERRDIPTRIVRLILDSLPDRGRAERGQTPGTISHTKIRLRVMAWTGAAPATIRRMRSRD